MIYKIYRFIKSKPVLFNILTFIYSFPFILSNIKEYLKGNIKIKGSYIRSVKIINKWGGVIKFYHCKIKNSKIILQDDLKKILIGENVNIYNSKIFISGDQTEVHIGNGTAIINSSILIRDSFNLLYLQGGRTTICNTTIWLESQRSKVEIKQDFTMQGGNISSIEGKCISIGEDCMFSDGIELRTGDSHGIYNLLDNKRINFAENIIIDDHVWLCANCKILKGSIIPKNSVVGNLSLVTKPLPEENSIYAGLPAKLIKRNITWSRNIN